MRAAAIPLVLLLSAAAADASSKAERFDATVRVLPGGDLAVTETIVMRFLDETFRELEREIPTDRSDGVDIVSAGIDGRTLPFGTNSGEVEVRRRSRVRVRWRFPPRSSAVRTFNLEYIVRGAVQKGHDGDLLVWRAPAQQHRWRIDAAALRFDLPDDMSAEVALRQHRTASLTTRGERGHVELAASGVRANGWIEASLRMPSGMIAAAPEWQERRRRANALAPRWTLAAGLIFTVGTIVLFGLRQSYDAPPPEQPSTPAPPVAGAPPLPDSLSPTIAGVVAVNGRVSLEHATAALLSLADRGVITFEQTSRGAFGVRSFTIARRGARGALSRYEEEALAIAFKGESDGTVTFAKARQRLTYHLRRFSRAVRDELSEAGLIDASRSSVRHRYLVVGIWFFVAAAVAIGPAYVYLRQYGPWPLLITVAWVLLAVMAFMFHTRLTPLSNDGARRRRHWLEFGRQLKAAAENPTPVFGTPFALLPYAVSLGAGGAWAKRLKRERPAAPPWFHSAGDEEAFAAFVATAGTRPAQAH